MSPRVRIRRLIRRLGQLEERSAREQRRLLDTLRREIQVELLTATGFRRFHLTGAMASVDRMIRVGRASAEQAAGARVEDAWRVGLELGGLTLPTRISLVAHDLSGELLSALADVTRDQVRAVWSELGTKLKTVIRRATLGVEEPFEAMKRLARAIRDPKTFGTAFNRAETIVRSEVNRTFGTAEHRRMEQADEALERSGERMGKWWLTAEDDRVRPAHVAAGRRYSRERPIPVREPFVVDGEDLMYPLDPSGSAENTINCRCVSVPVVMEA